MEGVTAQFTEQIKPQIISIAVNRWVITLDSNPSPKTGLSFRVVAIQYFLRCAASL